MAHAYIYEQLRVDWAATRHSADSRTALDLLASEEPSVAALHLRDLGELVARVQRGDPNSLGDQEAGDIVAAVLRSARVHPLCPRALVQTLSPGLVGVIDTLGDLTRTWDMRTDLHSDALSTLWSVVVDWAGQDRPWAARDILSAVRGRLRRQALAVEADRLHYPEFDIDLSELPAVGDRTDLEALAAALTEPAALGIDPTGAAVICLTRVFGYSLNELATLTGTSRWRLTARRTKAEQCLVA